MRVFYGLRLPRPTPWASVNLIFGLLLFGMIGRIVSSWLLGNEKPDRLGIMYASVVAFVWVLWSSIHRLSRDAEQQRRTQSELLAAERTRRAAEDAKQAEEAAERDCLRTVATAADEQAEEAPSDRWPWGGHHTELLGHLDAAARRWWALYDPDDPSTAPTNDTVSDWLMTDRKVSRRTAETMATILRADGLPTGRRSNP